jgi:hypothetical protein
MRAVKFQLAIWAQARDDRERHTASASNFGRVADELRHRAGAG